MRIVTPPPETTTRLGDWYANVLHVGRQRLALAVSEMTLLPVVISGTYVDEIRTALVELVVAA